MNQGETVRLTLSKREQNQPANTNLTSYVKANPGYVSDYFFLVPMESFLHHEVEKRCHKLKLEANQLLAVASHLSHRSETSIDLLI